MTFKTFRHPVAGSTVITPSGAILVFGGKTGGFGSLTTDNPTAIELLSALAAAPGNQVEEVREDAGVDAPASKTPDPAVAGAAADAAANTERAADPKVAAMQANLQAVLTAKN
jgi:hypothetical protein